MRYFTNTPLTEEQFAAYLDGMLTPQEAQEVESAIAADDDLLGIQQAIDDVDDLLLTDNYDITAPDECLSDDFVLPDIMAAHPASELNLFDDDAFADTDLDTDTHLSAAPEPDDTVSDADYAPADYEDPAPDATADIFGTTSDDDYSFGDFA